MTQKKLQQAFFFTLLTLVGSLALFMFLPFIGTVILAATFGVALHPIQQRFLHLFRGKAALAALATMVTGVVVILVPITIFGLRIFQETANLYSQLNSSQNWLTHIANDIVLREIHKIMPAMKIDLNDIVRQSVAWLASNLGALFTGTVQSLVHGFVFIISLYYVLKDGLDFKQAMIHYSPLPDEYDQEIYARLTRAMRSILMGSLLVAMIQGIFTGFGLYVFGIPNPTLWGSVAAICALVPGLGTALVWVPAILFTVSNGSMATAAGMTLWALIAVGTIDNILSPALVGRGVHIHPFFVLMSVVSGIGLFGASGFIFGPLLLSLLSALLDIYRMLILREKLKRNV